MIEARVPSGRLYSTDVVSVNLISFLAFTNLPVRLPEKEGVRRMYRTVENLMLRAANVLELNGCGEIEGR
jgi:hypothetical protein